MNIKTKYTHISIDEEIDFHIWKKNYSNTHSHDNFVEIMIITNGKINNIIDSTNIISEKKDLVFISSNILHLQTPYLNIPSKHYNLGINLATFSQACNFLDSKLFNTIINRYKYLSIHLSDIEFETIQNFSKQIIINSDKTEYIKKSFLIYLLNIISKYVFQQNQNQLPLWFQQYLNKIHNVNFETTNVKELYKLCNYSQSMIIKYFKKYLNITIVEYYNQIKLDYACSLLKNTNYTILEIALEIGFTSTSHFNHIFLEKYKITPTEYKKIK